jgi:hypothetical protein
MARGAWYREVAARLDATPDDVMVQLKREWRPDRPARYVWIDSRLRVWLIDKLGCVRSSARLLPF